MATFKGKWLGKYSRPMEHLGYTHNFWILRKLTLLPLKNDATGRRSGFTFEFGPFFRVDMLCKLYLWVIPCWRDTLPEINIALKIGHSKSKLVFQPSTFRGYGLYTHNLG